MDLNYEISNNVDVKSIGDLRNSVGWNSMTEFHTKSLCNSYFYICCYDNDSEGISEFYYFTYFYKY